MKLHLMSLEEVADETNVTAADLQDEVLGGHLPAHWVDGRWVFVRHEIDPFLEQLEEEDGDGEPQDVRGGGAEDEEGDDDDEDDHEEEDDDDGDDQGDPE